MRIIQLERLGGAGLVQADSENQSSGGTEHHSYSLGLAWPLTMILINILVYFTLTILTPGNLYNLSESRFLATYFINMIKFTLD